MPTFLSLLTTLLIFSVSAAPAAAAVCQAKSGNTTVALLELYTSEGCDSCPPADRWIAGLPQRGVTHKQVVPLALHVDYWNHLGWSDRFSQAAFTQRQRDIAQRANARVVYTPQVMLNGQDYRGWASDKLATDLERINRLPPRADVTLQLERQAQTVRVNAAAQVKQSAADAGLYIAVYENNLRTEIRAGENRGRTLDHAFVVRRLLGPLRIGANGGARIDETIALDKNWRTDNLGVAAFVQELNGTAVWQAQALALCR